MSKIKVKLALLASLIFANPAFATVENNGFKRPFTYETSCALEVKDEFEIDTCKVIETRDKNGTLLSRNIFSNRFALTIKGRFDPEKGYVTWDSYNKFEYKYEYKVGGVDGLGAWTYVMPGFLLQNVSWD